MDYHRSRLCPISWSAMAAPSGFSSLSSTRPPRGRSTRQSQQESQRHRGSLVVELKDAFPIIFHANNRPAFGFGLIENLVEAADRRVPVIGSFTRGLIVLNKQGEAENDPKAAQEEDDPELLLLRLRNVAEAQGNIRRKPHSTVTVFTRCSQSARTANSEVSMHSSVR